MSEDCLSANVWTPAVGERGKRPVMVWLHGGGFWQNSGSCEVWRGEALAAKHDVVVVSPNHRLNAFGYLYFGDKRSGRYANSNNLGLQDLVAALEWVRGNIAAFGGDPGNVSIFGESGGGRKVSALLAMPAAKGLFRRAIIQSGPLNEVMPRDRAAQATAALMAKLGLAAADFDILQSLPAEQIVAAMGGLQALLIPAADGQVLPQEPAAVLAPEMSASVPLIIGCNGTESTLFDLPPETLSDAEFLARAKSKLRLDDAALARLMDAYRQTHGSNTEACIALESDYSYRMPTILKAERRAAQRVGATYMYWFTWRSPVRAGRLRSPHAVELPFVFDQVDVGKALIGTEPDRQQLATAISSAWAAFARTGNPNHKGLPHWPAYDGQQRRTMIFDRRCSVVNDPGREDRLAFQGSGCTPFSGVPAAEHPTPVRMPGPAGEDE
jgi:para-nitrobenzyl esterase